MEVRTIDILCLLINVLLMLNLGKERFIGNIVLISFFEIALMSLVKNDFYNSLAKQNYIIIIIIIVVIIVIIITIIFIINIITVISNYFYYFYY